MKTLKKDQITEEEQDRQAWEAIMRNQLAVQPGLQDYLFLLQTPFYEILFLPLDTLTSKVEKGGDPPLQQFCHS